MLKIPTRIDDLKSKTGLESPLLRLLWTVISPGRYTNANEYAATGDGGGGGAYEDDEGY